MLDCFAIEEAFAFLRERTWIAVGWHTHSWRMLVLPVSKVFSLVDETDGFKWHRIDKKEHLDEGIACEQILKECYTEFEWCKEFSGCFPNTCDKLKKDSPLTNELKIVCMI